MAAVLRRASDRPQWPVLGPGSAPELAVLVNDGQVHIVQAAVVLGAIAHLDAADVEAAHGFQRIAQALARGGLAGMLEAFHQHLGRHIALDDRGRQVHAGLLRRLGDLLDDGLGDGALVREDLADDDAVAVGKTVVMMGYPSGPDRLLALLDDVESRGIQQRYGTPMAQLAYLAETKRIQPLTTQGSITDLDPRRIVYDARTAEGGSGAPLFGPSGRVIGVNFAVFTENQASNFAVPIRFAQLLLARSGWQAPEPKEGEAAAQTGHAGQSGAH